jgi:anti-sigma-K factor RskA
VDVSGCEHGIDAGAWALGALDERDAAAFEAHLRICAQCRGEVARLRVPADSLALATEQVTPPPELKDRIMREVAPAPARERRRERRWFLRPMPIAALAAATLAVGIAVGVLVSPGQSSRTVQANVSQAGASAVVHISGDHARLEVRGMRNPPAGHVYEVWVKRGSKAPEPAGALFTVMRGHGDVDVGSVKGVTTIMVTAEPAGGSRTPSGSPVITAAV